MLVLKYIPHYIAIPCSKKSKFVFSFKLSDLWELATVYRTAPVSWNKFKQQHAGNDPLLTFRHAERKPLPQLSKMKSISRMNELWEHNCGRWARGFPQTPHLCASQDSTWQSQLCSSYRYFPFLPCFLFSSPSLSPILCLIRTTSDQIWQAAVGGTPNPVSAGCPHESDRSSPPNALAGR